MYFVNSTNYWKRIFFVYVDLPANVSFSGPGVSATATVTAVGAALA